MSVTSCFVTTATVSTKVRVVTYRSDVLFGSWHVFRAKVALKGDNSFGVKVEVAGSPTGSSLTTCSFCSWGDSFVETTYVLGC